MKQVRRTAQFKADVKRMEKRGKNFTEFKAIVVKLLSGQELEAEYRDHALIGQYKGTRECHVEPDWLLIYELTNSEIVLIRTGPHTDLFR